MASCAARMVGKAAAVSEWRGRRRRVNEGKGEWMLLYNYCQWRGVCLVAAAVRRRRFTFYCYSSTGYYCSPSLAGSLLLVWRGVCLVAAAVRLRVNTTCCHSSRRSNLRYMSRVEWRNSSVTRLKKKNWVNTTCCHSLVKNVILLVKNILLLVQNFFYLLAFSQTRFGPTRQRVGRTSEDLGLNSSSSSSSSSTSYKYSPRYSCYSIDTIYYDHTICSCYKHSSASNTRVIVLIPSFMTILFVLAIITILPLTLVLQYSYHLFR